MFHNLKVEKYSFFYFFVVAPGGKCTIPQGVLLAPGRRVAGVHIEVEIPPFLVVDRLDAEGARSRGLAVLDAGGVVLLVLYCKI
jgi:hypothetical protein